MKSSGPPSMPPPQLPHIYSEPVGEWPDTPEGAVQEAQVEKHEF